ncbi:hypothetical protein KY349_03025 [Candidatus Woesearchaeota archaeon]|nr:hypothetical protein [Candidatus Woesearchaeota archaeon]
MKKAGEKLKSFAIHATFVLIVLVGLYFIVVYSASITGHAVLDEATAKAKLESALESSALFGQVQQTSICVSINEPDQPLSLRAVKTSAGWTVTETIGFCNGLDAEDIVIQFPGYDSYSEVVDNPSPRAIARAAISRDFEILPSRYIELGGNVICDATFKVKYCGALNTMATPAQLIEGDMACCIDKLTRSQKKMLEEHLEQDNFKDEIGIVETPGGIAGLGMTTSIIILVVVVLAILGGVGVVLMKKKGAVPAAKPEAVRPAVPGAPGAPVTGVAPAAESPEVTELRNYVVQAMGQGYTAEEIRAHLLEIGWDQATADNVVRQAQMQQGQQ